MLALRGRPFLPTDHQLIGWKQTRSPKSTHARTQEQVQPWPLLKNAPLRIKEKKNYVGAAGETSAKEIRRVF
jgi:hypothetical protein